MNTLVVNGAEVIADVFADRSDDLCHRTLCNVAPHVCENASANASPFPDPYWHDYFGVA